MATAALTDTVYSDESPLEDNGPSVSIDFGLFPSIGVHGDSELITANPGEFNHRLRVGWICTDRRSSGQ